MFMYMYSFLLIRASSGNHWLVSSKLGKVYGELRAEVREAEEVPPIKGWMFWNGSKWSDQDHTLECRRRPSVSCKGVSVELWGRAKKKHPDCAGRYLPVKGDYIRGREVGSMLECDSKII